MRSLLKFLAELMEVFFCSGSANCPQHLDWALLHNIHKTPRIPPEMAQWD